MMEDFLQDRFSENSWKPIFPILNHRLTRHGMCELAFSGSSMEIALSSGCPQGGLLSPLLGFLVVDDSIARLTGGDSYTRVTLMTFVL